MSFLIKSPRGTRDVFVEESYAWNFVLDIMKKQAKLYGFTQVRTPVFEYTELFSRSSGEDSDVVQKEMYTFLDRSGRSLTLRPEGTAGVARAVLELGTLATSSMPCKLFYILPCYRYERPQAGRLREFTQFGVEVFGTTSPLADANILLLAGSIFKALGLSSRVNLKINSVGCRNCRKSYVENLKNYLMENIYDLCPTCVERLKTNPMRVLDCKEESCIELAKSVPSVLEFICANCREHFSELKSLLDSLGVKYIVDNTIVRGLDYYTGTVFEFIFKEEDAEPLTLCGGGRYDDLIEQLGGASTPALGFGIGIDRLMWILEDSFEGPRLPKMPGPDVYIVSADAESKATCLDFARKLVNCGIYAECDIMQRSLASQLKHANKLNAKYSIVIGKNEIKENCAFLKNMSTGTKIKVKLDESFLKEIEEQVKLNSNIF